MPALGDFATVNNSLKTAKRAVVVAMHKFIYENEGDRNNRKRLRAFNGFDYEETNPLFVEKAAYVEDNLSTADLVSICNLLGISYDAENLFTHIFANLRNDMMLNSIDGETDDLYDDNNDDGANCDDEKRISTESGIIQERGESSFDSARSNLGKNVPLATGMGNKNTNNFVNDRMQSEDANGKQNLTYSMQQYNSSTPKFSLNFRDIEESVRIFDGTGNLSVNVWIEEFEETASIMCWDEVQKFIFAKRSLRGLAKLFVGGERGITDWSKLKISLIEEFCSVANSAQLHKLMTERKINKDESYQEYFLRMKELASRGNIENDALMQYVIDGIRDLTINKSILYGATDLKEFKEKLRCYEVMQERGKHNDNYKQAQPTKKQTKNEKRDLCFNCGEKGHTSRNCTNKDKGTKCFKCNNYGHISKQCSVRENNANVRHLSENHIMKKNIKFSEQNWLALFDSGSKYNIVSENVYNSLNRPKLKKSEFYLIGFGGNVNGNKVKPLGNFTHDVKIDDEMYNLTFHVVPHTSVDVDVILGEAFCLHACVTITPDTLKFEKIGKDDNYEVHSMMLIDVVDQSVTDVIHIDEVAGHDAKRNVIDLVQNYVPKKCKSTNVEMSIILKDESPIFSRPRRLPIAERNAVDEQVDRWLKDGIIEHSESEFSSPVVMVKKKDNSFRLCVDYRRINKVIVKDRYPLPLIEDQLDRLQNAKVFSTIDLKNGFFHVDLALTSRKYTSFVTHSGQYHFCKVPFGLSNSPAVFQRYINTIFRDFTRRGIALPYVDDVIIPGKDENDAVANLKEVIKACEDYGLELNFKKCSFLKTRVEFLGHIIENGKVFPSASKVNAVMKFPLPCNLKQLQSFLGLAGYFRKFIPQFSLIAKPLSDLTKSSVKFKMNDDQIAAFNELKRKLSDKPVLNIFNQQYETQIHTDASMYGYGAILLQKSPDDDKFHPVYYMSKKTTDAEKKYTSYELEILAVVEALKKFRVYLLGLHFTIVSDCNAFTKTMEKKDLCTRVARWVLLLQEYDYEVEHRAGTQMRHVDSLSRYPIMAISEDNTLIRLKQAQGNDDELMAIIHILQEKVSHDDYFMKGDLLYKLVDGFEVLVVPKGMQREIIRRVHEKGHFAFKKVEELIKRDYYIPKLNDKIEFHIANCVQCIVSNRKRGKQEGELHPIRKNEEPLYTYHIDHLGPLESTSKKYKYIFAVIDAFTKFCWLYPTRTTAANEVIMRLKNQSVAFGNPVQIISDRGSAFTCEEFNKYCQDENIKHFLITTGLPRANGQVERLNAIIVPVLSKLCGNDPTKWFRHVEDVQRIINSTYSRSINTTPFELMIGVRMRTKEDLEISKIVGDEFIKNFDDDRNELRQEAKQQIARVQAENRKTYNRRRKNPIKYTKGDLVAIKRTQFGPGLKLKAKFLGPYKVTNVKKNDTYDVTKIGQSEGPRNSSTCAEYMKPWYSELDDEFEANSAQDSRIVG